MVVLPAIASQPLSLRGLRATLVLRTVTLDSAIARELRDKWLRPALAGFGQGID